MKRNFQAETFAGGGDSGAGLLVNVQPICPLIPPNGAALVLFPRESPTSVDPMP